MEDDDPDTSSKSLKRPRSPSPTPSASISQAIATASAPDYLQRMPKRLRRSHDIPDYNAPVQARGLAPNRRMQKRAAKKARRDGRPKASKAVGSMAVDDIGLAGTFFTASGFDIEVEA